MKHHRGIALALVAVSGLLLSLAGIAAMPVSAAGPVNGHYGPVEGVDGSSMSIANMNLSVSDMVNEVAVLAPAVMTHADASTAHVSEWRVGRMGRYYVQVSGQYCKNKTGGLVFVADGAPVDSGLTC